MEVKPLLVGALVAKLEGLQNKSYSSALVFNDELFVAWHECGWMGACRFRPLNPDLLRPAGSEANSPATTRVS